MGHIEYLKQWNRRIRPWLLHRVYSRLYRDDDGDLSKTIIVAGAARSGTTWVAELIGSQLPSRIMFEPFHSRLVPDYSRFNYFQYLRADSASDELYAYCLRVLSGSIRHPWIDRLVDTRAPRLRIVKEIRTNLFLKWLHVNFPGIPILFIIRQPCAVVQSRMQLGWATDDDIEPFLSQSDLVEDFLSDKMDLIKSASTPEQKHAIIWCISNLVPLRQFSPGELTVVFYENLCIQPAAEVDRIFQTIGQAYQPSILAMLDRPSSTTKSTSALTRGDDRVAGWRDKLTSSQVEDILSIVREFNLDYLYGEGALPLIDANHILPIQRAKASYE